MINGLLKAKKGQLMHQNELPFYHCFKKAYLGFFFVTFLAVFLAAFEDLALVELFLLTTFDFAALAFELLEVEALELATFFFAAADDLVLLALLLALLEAFFTEFLDLPGKARQ